MPHIVLDNPLEITQDGITTTYERFKIERYVEMPEEEKIILHCWPGYHLNGEWQRAPINAYKYILMNPVSGVQEYDNITSLNSVSGYSAHDSQAKHYYDWLLTNHIDGTFEV